MGCQAAPRDRRSPRALRRVETRGSQTRESHEVEVAALQERLERRLDLLRFTLQLGDDRLAGAAAEAGP